LTWETTPTKYLKFVTRVIIELNSFPALF